MADTTHSMVTIDFWNTLVRGETGGETRRNVRVNALREIGSNYLDNLPGQAIDEAFKQTSRDFHQIWFDQRRTPTTEELVNNVLKNLEIPANKNELEYLVEEFEESLWEGPPELVEGVEEVLPELAGQYPLALISDTMYSPGRVLRKYLEINGVASYFNRFVFSDETGYSKPHPEAYTLVLEQAGCHPGRSWHIGDLLRTDIVGAKDVGMNAILFTGVTEPAEDGEKEFEVEPDHICGTWMEIGELLLGKE